MLTCPHGHQGGRASPQKGQKEGGQGNLHFLGFSQMRKESWPFFSVEFRDYYSIIPQANEDVYYFLGSLFEHCCLWKHYILSCSLWLLTACEVVGQNQRPLVSTRVHSASCQEDPHYHRLESCCQVKDKCDDVGVIHQREGKSDLCHPLGWDEKLCCALS